MNKQELKQRTDTAVAKTQEALQTVFISLNDGQKMKLLRNAAVKEIFDLYGVKY